MSDEKESEEVQKEKDKKTCRVCGGVGHLSYVCPNNIKCYRCGGLGHKSFDCPRNQKGYGYRRQGGYNRGYDRGYGNVKCFNCGKYGHKSFECNKPNGKNCYKCGKPGHISADCPENK